MFIFPRGIHVFCDTGKVSIVQDTCDVPLLQDTCFKKMYPYYGIGNFYAKR